MKEERFSIALDHHGPLVWVLSSLLFIGAHVLFFFGQYLVLWEIRALMRTHNVSVDCPGMFVRQFNDTNFHQQIQKYSYVEIVRALWNEKNVNVIAPYANVPFDVVSSSRMFATIVIIFSGIWPHAKLLATHILWYTKTSSVHRTRALQWLEFFGKWSMVDVISIVIAITVFSLKFIGSANDYAQNVFNGFAPFYDSMADPEAISHVICNGLSNWSEPEYNVTAAPAPSPNGCHHNISQFLDPTTAGFIVDIVQQTCATGSGFQGTVDIELAADTLEGVYYFSTAVWMSLLLSACINMRNEIILIRRCRLRRANEEQLVQHGASFLHNDSEFKEIAQGSELEERLIDDGPPVKKCATLFGHARMHWLWNVGTVILCGGGGYLLYVVQFEPIFQRDIAGSIHHVLDLVNNETDSEYRNYTMWDDAMTIVGGEGSDPFLQKDLVIFTVAGPLVCLLFAFVCAVIPLPKQWQWVSAKLAGLGFTFSGIEVLAFAAILCTALLPVQSADLIDTGVTFLRICQVMDHLYGIGENPCFYEAFSLILPAFAALPGLFFLTAVLHWMIHHVTSHVYPIHLKSKRRGRKSLEQEADDEEIAFKFE